ncbi:MAG: cytochrome c oxidase assembly protein [Actinomycetales bacterium]
MKADQRLIIIGAGTAVCLIGFLAMVTGLLVTGALNGPQVPGIEEADTTVTWGVPTLRALALITGVITVGAQLSAAFLAPSGRDGVLSRSGRNSITIGYFAALTWAMLLLLLAVAELANVLALSWGAVLQPGVLATYLWEVPTARAALLGAVLAFIVAIGSVLTATTGLAAIWLILALVAISLPSVFGHGSALGDHALAMTSSTAHAVAAALWVGGLAFLIVQAFMRPPVEGGWNLATSTQRFGRLATVCLVVVAISGVGNAYTRLEYPAQLWETGYGQIVLTKFVAILCIGAIAMLLRRILHRRPAGSKDRGSERSQLARVAVVELTILTLAMGMGLALASSAPPRFLIPFDDPGEYLLGTSYPGAPSFTSVTLGFRLEPLFLSLSLVAAALYVIGYLRLRRRGDQWPLTRLLCWLVGIGLVIWCTNASISLYAQVSVGLHMVQHMTLTMLAPIFLVLGAPATLALRALAPSTTQQRGPREWLLWLLNSPVAMVLTNPFYVFIVYVFGTYALYLTGAFATLMGTHIGHVAMQAHFLISGYLFAWVLIGIDPRPRPVPYWGRILMLLLALAFHGFFAVSLMMRTEPLAPEWYSVVRPDWVTDPLADTLAGAQVAWGLSEIPTLILLVVIAVQWARSDEREAKRRDRQADRDDDAELRAYNENLQFLADRSNKAGRS